MRDTSAELGAGAKPGASTEKLHDRTATSMAMSEHDGGPERARAAQRSVVISQLGGPGRRPSRCSTRYVNGECGLPRATCECDAIIMGQAKVTAIPGHRRPTARTRSLVHEAAIGKIAGDQIIKLMTLGLTEKEAEDQIVNGFLQYSFAQQKQPPGAEPGGCFC